MGSALSNIRVCDFTGQLAGAGATKFLAAFGAQVIRIEDPVRKGSWDILRGNRPYVDERRGPDMGGAFNNHNVEKLGITINMREQRGIELVDDLIRISDVVTENFAVGVLAGWGLTYERMREIKPDIIYASNCGFGHRGPYRNYKTWGPIVQAVCGLTFTSGLPGELPAGWGYSYMDHHGGNFMATAILAALIHRHKTGEGQWIDIGCTESGAALLGPAILDYTVNGVATRRDGSPDSNHSPDMAPHAIYRAAGVDEWVAIACRSDEEWHRLAAVLGADSAGGFATLAERLDRQTELDALVRAWTSTRNKFAVQHELLALGIPCAAVQRPGERVDHDPATSEWGLWPTVTHSMMGEVRVDGIGAHLSDTDWTMTRGAPCLGEHTDHVLAEVLGRSAHEIAELRAAGIV
jgi:benzylsuccinate CoA-transferase BbsF subunit